MTAVTLNVNGKFVTAEATPRTHLADFLRDSQDLTGTHIGCEHGVCGACTVEINGEISRACITYAVVCEGATVRTIEGFNDDAVMALLRDAFTAEHALQCGYCTPGMLIAARDLICRRGTLTEPQIRVEMSGNLCRCTGYAGIVRAIARVMTAVTSEMKPAHPVTAWLGPAPGPTAGGSLAATGRAQTSSVVSDRTTSPARQIKMVTGPIRLDGATTRLTQSFVITQPLAQVWARLADLGSVVPCMPGAALDGPLRDDGAFTAHLALWFPTRSRMRPL